MVRLSATKQIPRFPPKLFSQWGDGVLDNHVDENITIQGDELLSSQLSVSDVTGSELDMLRASAGSNEPAFLAATEKRYTFLIHW